MSTQGKTLMDPPKGGWTNPELMGEPGTTQAERDQYAKDAARYRWLCEEWSNRKWRHVPIGAGMEGDDITSPEEIDAIIDKAMMGGSSE